MAAPLTQAQRDFINVWKSEILLERFHELTFDEKFIIFAEAGIPASAILRLGDAPPQVRAAIEQKEGKRLPDSHTFLGGVVAITRFAEYVARVHKEARGTNPFSPSGKKKRERSPTS
jgi:hypothetical protein